MIVLKISNIYTDIVGDLPSKDYKDIEKRMSFRPQGFQFSTMYNRWIRNSKGKPVRRLWDGWKRQCWKNKSRTYFPTGLLSIAYNYFNENDIPFKIIDSRHKPQSNINLSTNSGLEYRDYQQDIIKQSCSRTRGIIQAATGSGKTIIATGILNELKVSPFIFFVTSVDLLEQAKDSLESSLIDGSGEHIVVGQIGGGIIDIRDINVMTIQTAVRALDKSWNKYKFDTDDSDDKTPIEAKKDEIKSLIQSAKLVICDEVQHWRASTCQLVAKDLRDAYYTFGMSATPYRDEADDLMIQACFGKQIGQITASELIKEGWLIRPDIKIVHIEMPKSKFMSWQSIYKEQVVENKTYNGIIANITNAYIERGRHILVLVQQIIHGKSLEGLITGSLFLSGKSPKEKRKNALNKLRKKEISCIISTSIFDEGIDVRALDTLVLAGQGKSKVRAMQRVGRVLRPFTDPKGNRKDKATVIDFCLDQKYLRDHAIAREKMYRSEPEYSIDHIER